MTEMSITDMRVVAANAEMYGRLYDALPAGIVLEFFEKANEWEVQNSQADQVKRNADMIRHAVSRASALRDRADRVAGDFARFAVECNAVMLSLAAQLTRGHDGPVAITWRGLEHLGAGRGCVVFLPHIGYFQAAPVVLVALGRRSEILSNPFSPTTIRPALAAVAPDLIEKVGHIRVPDPGSARTALTALAEGRVIVLFPEVNMGATGNVRATRSSFLDREIWVPRTAARMARIADVPVIPMTMTPGTQRQVVIEFGKPITVPPDRSADREISTGLFAWLEQLILDRPHL